MVSKKIILLATVLCMSVQTFADSISPDRAAAYARQCLGCAGVTLEWDGTEPGSKSASANPSFYLFNNPGGGWCIIAGDDVATPVLAMNGEGGIDKGNLPPALRQWLDGVESNINAAKSQGLTAGKGALQGKMPLATVGSSEKLLKTPAWGQNVPYNEIAVTKTGVPGVVTGCVATAMAEVLRYNKWPAKGKGTIPGYTTTTLKKTLAPVNLEGYAYNWDKMPLEASTREHPWNAEEKAEVAALMYHCGTMVNMDYNTEAAGGSSASEVNIINALATHMSYYKGARILYRNMFGDSEWLSMIRSEIDAGRPLIYGANDFKNKTGHMFVCDGYNANNQVHVNWGWDGSANGWYAVCYINAEMGRKYVFDFMDLAIFTLKPDESGSGAHSPFIYMTAHISGSENWMGITPYHPAGKAVLSPFVFTFSKATPIYLQAGIICMEDMEQDYSGKFKIGLFDYAGNLKEWIGEEMKMTWTRDERGCCAFYVKPYVCIPSKEIVFGDYLAAYITDSNGEWSRIGSLHDARTGMGYPYVIDKMGAANLAYIRVPSQLSAGQVIYPELQCGEDMPLEISWYYDKIKNSKGFVTVSSGRHEIEADVKFISGMSCTIRKIINVN